MASDGKWYPPESHPRFQPPPPPPPNQFGGPQPIQSHPGARQTISPITNSGNGFSTAGIIIGAVAFLFFPIILGPVGLILGAVGKSKGEPRAVVAMVVSGCGLVIGMIIGAIVGLSP